MKLWTGTKTCKVKTGVIVLRGGSAMDILSPKKYLGKLTQISNPWSSYFVEPSREVILVLFLLIFSPTTPEVLMKKQSFSALDRDPWCQEIHYLPWICWGFSKHPGVCHPRGDWGFLFVSLFLDRVLLCNLNCSEIHSSGLRWSSCAILLSTRIIGKHSQHKEKFVMLCFGSGIPVNHAPLHTQNFFKSSRNLC